MGGEGTVMVWLVHGISLPPPLPHCPEIFPAHAPKSPTPLTPHPSEKLLVSAPLPPPHYNPIEHVPCGILHPLQVRFCL
jgi:hypothetical protein